MIGKDLINYIMRKATVKFGGEKDGMFNAAAFSGAWKDVTGLGNTLDGLAVEAMLHGRSDVEILAGGCHYRMVQP